LIGPKGAILISKSLKENAALSTFDINRNPIDNEGVIALAHSLLKNNTMQELNLQETNLGDQGVIEGLVKLLTEKSLNNKVPLLTHL